MEHNEQHLKTRTKVAHPQLTMMGLYLGAFVGMFGETALNIAMPQLVQAFQVNTSLMQWMVIGHMLIIGLVLPLASILMKWFSVRKLTLFAISIFLIGSLISAFAGNFPILLLGRMVQGVGPGLLIPMMFAMVLEVFPPHKIGSAMGLCALIIMFAPAIGPTAAGLLMGTFSWRAIFVAFAVLLAVAMLFTLKFMISPYELTKPKIDGISCLLSALGFAGIVVGVGIASVYGWISVQVIGCLVIGLICLAFYVKRQFKLEHPVLNMNAFKVSGFRTGTILVMLTFGITLSSMYLMPQYLQSGLLIPVALTGVILLPGGVANAVFSLIAGRLYDRIGPKVPVMCGFLLAAIGTGMLLISDADSSTGFIILSHIVLLTGVPLALSPSQTNGLNSLPHELSTDGSAILNTLQQVWGAVCTAIATSLLGIGRNAFTGADPTGALSFTKGVHYGLIFTLALAIAGFLISFTVKKKSPAAKPEHAEEELHETPLRAIMKTDVYAIQADASLLDALKLITEKKISGMPVLNNEGIPVSFISDGDILKYLAKAHPLLTHAYSISTINSDETGLDEKLQELASMKVSDIASKKVISVDVNDELADIFHVLGEYHLKKAPVMEDGKMVGIINRSNITKYALNLYKQQLS